MIIDCDSCEVRGLACDDCVVTALLGSRPPAVQFDEGERAAIDVLATSGLVPPLRLVMPLDHRDGSTSGDVHNAHDVPVDPASGHDGRGPSVAAG